MRPPQPRGPTPLLDSSSLSHCLLPLEMQCIPFQAGQVLRGDLQDIRLVNAGRGRRADRAQAGFLSLSVACPAVARAPLGHRMPSTPRSCGSTLDDRLARPISCHATGADGASCVWLPSMKVEKVTYHECGAQNTAASGRGRRQQPLPFETCSALGLLNMTSHLPTQWGSNAL